MKSNESNSPECLYLDNNATSPADPEVLSELTSFLQSDAANPSSKHEAGMEAKMLLMKARKTIAGFLGASPNEIIFTSGATESIKTAFNGILDQSGDKNEIIISKAEHKAVLDTAAYYAEKGFKVHYLGVDERGYPDLEEMKGLVNEKTAIVSIIWVNNETGIIAPVADFGAFLKDRDAVFHVDATQAVGKIEVQPEANYIDLLSFSGHKIHALPGCGVLYKKKDLQISPLLRGSQEFHMRGGTQNLPGIVTMGAAVQILERRMLNFAEKINALREELEAEIKANIPGAEIVGENSDRVCNTVNVVMPGADGSLIAEKLSKQKIYVSTGSACASGDDRPSHVLTAMGYPEKDAKGCIRISLGRFNKKEDIKRFMEAFMPAVEDQMKKTKLYALKGA